MQHEYTSLSDKDLIERSSNEAAAFSELVRRYHGFCLRVAGSILSEKADAEDAVQNALLSAYIHLPNFQLRATFKTWLMRIVTNQSLMIIRKSRRARQVPIESGSHRGPENTIELRSTGKTPEEIHFAQELGATLHKSLRRLPAGYGRVMSMQAMDQLGHMAIADCLEITPEAAKSRIYRAKRELRRRLEEQLSTKYSSSTVRLMRTA